MSLVRVWTVRHSKLHWSVRPLHPERVGREFGRLALATTPIRGTRLIPVERSALNRLQLLQVMDVVTGQLRHDPADGQLAVLRMGKLPIELFRREAAPHREVELAQRGVGV